MLTKLFCLVISFGLCACASVPLPKGEACVANVAGGYNLCFDMTKDFDANGNVTSTSHGIKYPIDFTNRVNFDPASFASLKAYLLKLGARCNQGKN